MPQLHKYPDQKYLHHFLTTADLERIFDVTSHNGVRSYEVADVVENFRKKIDQNPDEYPDKVITIRTTVTRYVVHLRINRLLIHDRLTEHKYLENCLYEGEIVAPIDGGRASLTNCDAHFEIKNRERYDHTDDEDRDHYAYTGLLTTPDATFKIRPVPDYVLDQFTGETDNRRKLHFVIPEDDRHQHPKNYYHREDDDSHNNEIDPKDLRFHHPNETGDVGHDDRTILISPSNKDYYSYVVDDGRKSRQRRQTNNFKYMELLVAVDRSFQSGLQRTTMLRRLFTILNEAQNLFKVPSMNPKLILIVKRLVLLPVTSGNPSPGSNNNILTYLETFCAYQSQFSDIDNSILISSLNLRTASSDRTIGMAYVPGTCRRRSRCGVIQVTSSGTGSTISHEIGHNLNMGHDCRRRGNSQCNCNIVGIMGPTLSTVRQWSSCSMSSYNSYLTRTNCLNAFNSQGLDPRITERLEGRFSLDAQCAAQSAGSRTQVTNSAPFNNPCANLYCVQGTGDPQRQSAAALDGTVCDIGRTGSKICSGGSCVGTNVAPNPNPNPNPATPSPPIATTPRSPGGNGRRRRFRRRRYYRGRRSFRRGRRNFNRRLFQSGGSSWNYWSGGRQFSNRQRFDWNKRSIESIPFSYVSPDKPIVKRSAAGAQCQSPSWYEGDTRTWCTKLCGGCLGVVDDRECSGLP